MSDLSLNGARLNRQATTKPDLDSKPHVNMIAVFLLFLVSGIGYAAYGIFTETRSVGEPLALGALLLAH
jgi:PiT family inorganic phosphate transporter